MDTTDGRLLEGRWEGKLGKGAQIYANGRKLDFSW